MFDVVGGLREWSVLRQLRGQSAAARAAVKTLEKGILIRVLEQQLRIESRGDAHREACLALPRRRACDEVRS